MTLFGIIWFIIILWFLIKKTATDMVFLTVFFMTLQSTNVLYIGGSGIGPGVLTSIACVIKIIVGQNLKFRKMTKPVLVYIVSVIMLLVVAASLYFNNTLADRLMLFMQITSYVICFICIQLIRNSISIDELYQSLRKIFIFHAIFGFIQLLTTMNILPLRSLLRIIFYNDTSRDVLFNGRAFYVRVMSTFMEPSYFAGFVVGAFYLLLMNKNKIRQNLFLLAALFIELLLTQSSTAYGAFVIVGLFIILFSKTFTIKQKIIICVIGVAGLLVLYFGFYSLLDAVIFSKSETGSYVTRVRYNNSALKAFYDSPYIGVGYKNVRGSSIIYSLLGQLGIIGLCCYFFFNVSVFLTGIRKLKKTDVMLNASKIGVLGAITCQIIACPDLDLCTYWIWLYIFSLTLFAYKYDKQMSLISDENYSGIMKKGKSIPQ